MAAPNPFDQQKNIPGVKKIIAVSSGKGGVGKSTVATNLALSLSHHLKVGLLDADIYGPSIPRMMGALNQKPNIGPDGKLQPLNRFGIKMMSIGFLVDENSALIWRGPMLFKAIDQFFKDVEWGDLDVLVIDLPPGTGDVQLTIAQKIPLSGAVMVSTPQNIALVDVKKAIDMFDKVNVPIWGLIENMSFMINPVNGEKIQLYPKGDLEGYLQSKEIKKLGEIPFHTQVSMSSEMGIPIVESNPQSEEAKAFENITQLLLKYLKL